MTDDGVGSSALLGWRECERVFDKGRISDRMGKDVLSRSTKERRDCENRPPSQGGKWNRLNLDVRITGEVRRT